MDLPLPKVPPQSRNYSGFTLIELLVVISIIVVLLALLTPALDKAIYQAELAVCGTHLRTIGTGVTTYAFDHKRQYPYRPGVHSEGTTTEVGSTYLSTNAWHPHKIWNGGSGSAGDDRIRLRDYMGINGAMNDPLAEQVDFEGARNGSQTYASYYLWFGYKFKGHNGMDRIGGKLSWKEPTEAQTKRFDVLAGDQDDVRYRDGAVPATFASHSDDDGKLASKLYQDSGSPQSALARWESPGAVGRGPMNMQFVFAAGDVGRFEGVELEDDDRMEKVPVFQAQTETGTMWSHLPR